MRILGSTQYSRDEDRFHSGTHSVKQWDKCPRCGELKYSTAKLCGECSVEYRAAKMKAKSMVKRLLDGEKFVMVLREDGK